MRIIQPMVSPIHKSAFFYHGVIAEKGEYKLETYQDGEISVDLGFETRMYVGEDTPKIASETDICDADIQAETIVNIHVDKFFGITWNGNIINEDMLFDDYEEATTFFNAIM